MTAASTDLRASIVTFLASAPWPSLYELSPRFTLVGLRAQLSLRSTALPWQCLPCCRGCSIGVLDALGPLPHYDFCGQSCLCCRWRVFVQTQADYFHCCEDCEAADALRLSIRLIRAYRFGGGFYWVAQACLLRAPLATLPEAKRRVLLFMSSDVADCLVALACGLRAHYECDTFSQDVLNTL